MTPGGIPPTYLYTISSPDPVTRFERVAVCPPVTTVHRVRRCRAPPIEHDQGADHAEPGRLPETVARQQQRIGRREGMSESIGGRKGTYRFDKKAFLRGRSNPVCVYVCILTGSDY